MNIFGRWLVHLGVRPPRRPLEKDNWSLAQLDWAHIIFCAFHFNLLATGSNGLLPRFPSTTTALALHLRKVNPTAALALDTAHREGDTAAELEAAHRAAALHAAEGVCPQLVGREGLDGGEDDVVDAGPEHEVHPVGEAWSNSHK